MNQRTLKSQLTELIRAWPVLIGVITAAGFLGWGILQLWPPDSTARADLYLGIQIDRVLDISSLAPYTKTEPLNIDGYKNWQLSQFQAVATSQQTASRTLERLQEQDPAWADVSPGEFQEKASLAWYDTGRWQLLYRGGSPEAGLQAVTAWREELQEEMTFYLEHAREAYALEGSLRALDATITAARTRVLGLADLRSSLEVQLEELNQGNPDNILPADDRLNLLSTVGSASTQDPNWTRILDSFPPEGSSRTAYQSWLEHVDRTAAAELAGKEQVIQDLEGETDRILDQYLAALKEAQGFSPALIVDQLDPEPELHTAAPDGIVLVVSALIGLILYLMYFFLREPFRGHK